MESCCVEKALRGDLSDPSCIAAKKGINWFFWGGVVLLVIALCIIGFFVYKKYFAPSYNFGEDNFGENNFDGDNSGGNNFGGDNFGDDNFVIDNFDKADLEILNMPIAETSK